jgi:hypothetical protein
MGLISGRAGRVAKRKVTDKPSLEANLHQIDMSSAPQNVVVSVRLDGDVARQLAKVAAVEGRRLSDVLRDAADQYVGMGAGAPVYSVATINYTVQFGPRMAATTPAMNIARRFILWGDPTESRVGPAVPLLEERYGQPKAVV